MMIYEETQCQCDICVSMCNNRPCWPTPKEAEKLIDEGYGNRLMLDYFFGKENSIDILSPASKGSEGISAPHLPQGCTFFDGRSCELHDKGFKPLEGRVDSCKNDDNSVHEDIVEMWDSDEGRIVVERWIELYRNRD